MKYKNFRYIMPVMLLLWMMFTTSSCVRDEFADESGSADCSSVTIKVKMPELSVTAPGSRAVASDFDTMDDINIFIRVFSLMFQKTSFKTPEILIKTRA